MRQVDFGTYEWMCSRRNDTWGFMDLEFGVENGSGWLLTSHNEELSLWAFIGATVAIQCIQEHCEWSSFGALHFLTWIHSAVGER